VSEQARIVRTPSRPAGRPVSPGDATIRDACPGDGAAAIALWTEGYVTEGGGGRTEPYREPEFLDTSRRGRVFVAEGAGAVVGVVALLAPGTEGRAVARGGEAELSRLAVSASARRRGTGAALVRHCEEVARAEEWEAIALWSRRYQVAAHRLYESLGYVRAPDRDSVDGTGHERLVFRLDLGDERPTQPRRPLPE
jgi:ribosomal protein S18 acetylase RimI-like enzyme